MKKAVTFLCAIFMSFLSTSALASSTSIPAKGFGRINWSVLCSGAPNHALYIAIALLAVLIVISIFYYKKISGGEK